MSASHPFLSKAHKQAEQLAIAFSAHLLPRTGAYHEIWLDDQKVIDTSPGNRGKRADLWAALPAAQVQNGGAVPPGQ